MALLATHYSQYAQPLGLEFDIKLKKAVHAQDTLTMTWRVRDAWWKPSLNGDLTQLDGSVVNQHGETVLLGASTILVMPKPAEDSVQGSTQQSAKEAVQESAQGSVRESPSRSKP
jgi:acyl dehydratase